MKSKERMISQLPIYERDNELFNDIYDAFGDKTDKFLYEIEDLYKQLNINTATWGLDIWEKNVGLDNNKELTYSQRRGRIKSRLKGFSKIDTELLEDILQEYYENDVEVTFDGRVLFKIPLENDSWKHRPIIKEIIDILKPAHLGYDIDIYTKPVETTLFTGANTVTGESMTVYPESVKDIELKNQVFTSFVYESIYEEVTLV